MIFIIVIVVSNDKQSFKVKSGNILPQVTIFVIDLIKIYLLTNYNFKRIMDEFEQNRVLNMLNDGDIDCSDELGIGDENISETEDHLSENDGHDTDFQEITALIGILILAGVNKSGKQMYLIYGTQQGLVFLPYNVNPTF